MTTATTRFVAPLVALIDGAFAALRRIQLRAIHIARASNAGASEADEPDACVLLVANHVSWWDGYLLRLVQRRLRPRASLITIMADHELARRRYFRWAGAIGVDPASFASVRRMLRTMHDLRATSRRTLVVSYFPQGRIWPSSKRPLGFKRGVAAIAKQLAPVVIVPVSLHIEPMTTSAPHAFVYVGDAIVARDGALNVTDAERRVTDGLDRIRRFLDAFGEDAIRRWPELSGWQ